VQTRKTVKTWEKTRVQFLLRHRSGAYYARCYAGGKEHWKNLDTSHFSVAHARLPDALKELRSAVAKNPDFGKRRMTFGDAAGVFMQNPTRDADAKASTLRYVEEVLAAIYASWPDLEAADIRKITVARCRGWAREFAAKYSATRYNAALSVLRRIFRVAIREGVRFDNPAEDETITRKKVRSKVPALPPVEKFAAFVAEIRSGGGRFSADCADFVEGLAFTGMRRGEAEWLVWSHLDFKANRVRVVGDPADGTKNREERSIPMIADARALFERMRAERSDESPDSLVFRVNEAQKAMDRAAKAVGMDRITHHDLRHLFATTCIEAGVDIPTISRWLGHKDGGALAMRTYGHLRDEHSEAQARRVSFQPADESKIVRLEGAV
jgi:integrase